MKIDPKAIKFLESQKICALTILLPDGSPHASSLHYSYKENPLELYFSTDRTSKKCKLLIGSKSAKASFVIGFKDDENTLQMDGLVEMVNDLKIVKQIEASHYQRNPNSAEWKDDPNTVFLVFRPTWWRYTDYSPFKIYSSEKQNEP